MVAISSLIMTVAVFLSSSAVAAPNVEARQDPNPQIFSLSLYNDCTQTVEINPVGLTRTPTLNQQGCYDQTTPFGALFINAHVNGHPECRLITYTGLGCTGTAYGNFSQPIGTPPTAPTCRTTGPNRGYQVSSAGVSRSIRFIC
ncbi:hypothetical protein GLAREA_02185 [Glarea lozoyensis ATCC 20868]|uniref:Uncharacterized protein n=2 Tax=Glarea lozoyensis TaxID=101852 RepID=S3DIA1_GLAL2|nr:uncharacterized protein GLAREA_02185 [Glarea lozoyensis ATCC 20868]EHL02801.1 hypothetical protein M7I_1140 [Glarea lozoyensis 74030]EPE26273.1 hypothetical protein GLAREA_02185 [Glarea lozoyensis ATCC 20868]